MHFLKPSDIFKGVYSYMFVSLTVSLSWSYMCLSILRHRRPCIYAKTRNHVLNKANGRCVRIYLRVYVHACSYRCQFPLFGFKYLSLPWGTNAWGSMRASEKRVVKQQEGEACFGTLAYVQGYWFETKQWYDVSRARFFGLQTCRFSVWDFDFQRLIPFRFRCSNFRFSKSRILLSS